MSRRSFDVTPELLLRAYQAGLFPMAETRDGDRLYWLDPERRGILPLDKFHLSRRLRRTVLSDQYDVRSDSAFAEVIAGCAQPAEDREDTWINGDIERMFNTLHKMGHAHSVETFQDGRLVGGLYGVALGGVFFGESMFSQARDASKIALVHLVVRLRLHGYRLLDTQFVTSHLAQFGTVEIPRDIYRARLTWALATPSRWLPDPTRAEIVAELDRLAGRTSPAESA